MVLGERPWQAALEAGYDKLEEALYERAVREDTQAAIFLLKGYRRNKFFERHQVEVGSPPDFDFTQLTSEEREQVRLLMEKAQRMHRTRQISARRGADAALCHAP